MTNEQLAAASIRFWNDDGTSNRVQYSQPSASAYGPNPAGMQGIGRYTRADMANALRPIIPEPAGHRVTLTRPRFLRSPLVIRTNANPDHGAALADLRAMFKTSTGREYLPRRGDTLSHEVTR